MKLRQSFEAAGLHANRHRQWNDCAVWRREGDHVVGQVIESPTEKRRNQRGFAAPRCATNSNGAASPGDGATVDQRKPYWISMNPLEHCLEKRSREPRGIRCPDSLGAIFKENDMIFGSRSEFKSGVYGQTGVLDRLKNLSDRR